LTEEALLAMVGTQMKVIFSPQLIVR
jgi:hypothetical protein